MFPKTNRKGKGSGRWNWEGEATGSAGVLGGLPGGVQTKLKPRG